MKQLLPVIGMFYCCNVLLSGCASIGGSGGHSSVPENSRITGLEWGPTMGTSDLDSESIELFRSVVVTITALEDVRENKSVIGRTPEDLRVRDSYVPIATKRNVAKWCRNALYRSLDIMGISSDPKKGMLRLEVDLTEVMIADDITQSGKIGLRISAYTADDMLVWEGRISGSSDLYVKPKDSDGISECLSNTVMVTLENLCKEQSFRDAVAKTFNLK